MITRKSASNTLAASIATHAEHGPVLLLLSGGSAVAIGAGAYAQLTTELRNNVTVTLTDERFGPIGHVDSNWAQLKQAGLSAPADRSIKVLIPEAHTIAKSAVAFESALKSALEYQPYVIALLGVGTDHHTAGILPHSPLTQISDRLVGSYSSGQYERISITPAFFPLIDQAYLYAEGAAKAEAVKALKGVFPVDSYPSQLLKHTKQYEVLYNEEAA